jgi:hypothetical protein
MTELDPKGKKTSLKHYAALLSRHCKVRLVKATPRSPIGSPVMALR